MLSVDLVFECDFKWWNRVVVRNVREDMVEAGDVLSDSSTRIQVVIGEVATVSPLYRRLAIYCASFCCVTHMVNHCDASTASYVTQGGCETQQSDLTHLFNRFRQSRTPVPV